MLFLLYRQTKEYYYTLSVSTKFGRTTGSGEEKEVSNSVDCAEFETSFFVYCAILCSVFEITRAELLWRCSGCSRYFQGFQCGQGNFQSVSPIFACYNRRLVLEDALCKGGNLALVHIFFANGNSLGFSSFTHNFQRLIIDAVPDFGLPDGA